MWVCGAFKNKKTIASARPTWSPSVYLEQQAAGSSCGCSSGDGGASARVHTSLQPPLNSPTTSTGARPPTAEGEAALDATERRAELVPVRADGPTAKAKAKAKVGGGDGGGEEDEEEAGASRGVCSRGARSAGTVLLRQNSTQYWGEDEGD
jgi:hypothetical protein